MLSYETKLNNNKGENYASLLDGVYKLTIQFLKYFLIFEIEKWIATYFIWTFKRTFHWKSSLGKNSSSCRFRQFFNFIAIVSRLYWEKLVDMKKIWHWMIIFTQFFFPDLVQNQETLNNESHLSFSFNDFVNSYLIWIISDFL